MQYIPYLDIDTGTIASQPSNRAFTSQQAIELARELPQHPFITRVILKRNGIDDDGAKALSKVKQIKYLDLTGNYVGDVGAKALAKNTTLEELYLDENPITKSGVEAFFSNYSIEKLGLHRLDYVSKELLMRLQHHIALNSREFIRSMNRGRASYAPRISRRKSPKSRRRSIKV